MLPATDLSTPVSLPVISPDAPILLSPPAPNAQHLHPSTASPQLSCQPLAPSRDALLLVALVQRCPATVSTYITQPTCHTHLFCTCHPDVVRPHTSHALHSPRPSNRPASNLHHRLSVVYQVSPNGSNEINDERVLAARAALLGAPSLVFPSDLPMPAELPLTVPTSLQRRASCSPPPAPIQDETHLLRRSEPVLPAPCLPIARTAPIVQSPTRPFTKVHTSVSNSSYPLSAANLAQHIHQVRVLPTTPPQVRDVMVEQTVKQEANFIHDKRNIAVREPLPTRASFNVTASVSKQSVRRVLPANELFMPVHRAKSYPRRSLRSRPHAHDLCTIHTDRSATSTTPVHNNPPICSSSSAPIPALEESGHLDSSESSAQELRRSLLLDRRRTLFHVLLNAKTHVNAVTLKNGSRIYAYCRPISALHAIVVFATCVHTPIYLSAVEKAAAHYALLIDDDLDVSNRILSPASQNDSVDTSPIGEHPLDSPLHLGTLSCSPAVAKKLCTSLLKSLGLPSTCTPSSQQNVQVPSNSLQVCSSDIDEPKTYVSPTSTSNIHKPFTSKVTLASVPSTKDYLENTNEHEELSKRISFVSEDSNFKSIKNGSSSSETLPWVVAAESAKPDTVGVVRTVELADATLLFQHFPVRSIVSVLVALLEERHVCIVGPDSAVVSRVVLAFANLLRPFEWPHTMSPIIVEHMVPVLGAPFPFLVGLLEDHFPQTKALDLCDVVFADMSSGKITTTAKVGDLYRRVPRRLRSKIERRLTRTRTVCLRQLNKCNSVQPTSSAVVAASTLVKEEDALNATPEKVVRPLWKSRSHQKFSDYSSTQNIWLEHSSVVALDRSMRKFFAELLEDLPSVRRYDEFNGSSPSQIVSEITGSKSGGMSKIASAPSRREAGKVQLVRAFSQSQMFMQWEQGDQCDFTFGLAQSDFSRRKNAQKDKALGNEAVISTESNIGEHMLKKTRLSRVHLGARYEDDLFSGDETLSPAEDVGPSLRVKLRSLRKSKGGSRMRPGPRVNGNVQGLREVMSDGESREGIEPDIKVQTQEGAEADFRCGESEPERESSAGGFAKRAWHNLKRPSSSWIVAPQWLSTREFGMFPPERDSVIGDAALALMGGEGIDAVQLESENEMFERTGLVDTYDGEEAAPKEFPLPLETGGRGRIMGWGRRRSRVIGETIVMPE